MKNAYDRKFKKQNETGQKQFNDFVVVNVE